MKASWYESVGWLGEVRRPGMVVLGVAPVTLQAGWPERRRRKRPWATEGQQDAAVKSESATIPRQRCGATGNLKDSLRNLG